VEATMMGSRILAIGVVTFGLALGAARAQDAADPAIRATIQTQMDALARDDAAGAYEMAAPGIKAMFTDPTMFMAMVKNQYTPVYRHRSADFGPAEASDDAITQSVTIVDESGIVWTALYRLAKQPDGQWRITACFLTKTPATDS
jgi:hypothetical protein